MGTETPSNRVSPVGREAARQGLLTFLWSSNSLKISNLSRMSLPDDIYGIASSDEDFHRLVCPRRRILCTWSKLLIPRCLYCRLRTRQGRCSAGRGGGRRTSAWHGWTKGYCSFPGPESEDCGSRCVKMHSLEEPSDLWSCSSKKRHLSPANPFLDCFESLR